MGEFPSVANQFQDNNPGGPGRPKGKLNLSTLVKKLAEDERLADKMFKRKPEWWDILDDKNMASAIVGAMMMRAASGDSKAATWFRKSGWGDKLDITSDDRPIVPLAVLDMNPPPKGKVKRATVKRNKPKAKPSVRTGKKPKDKKA